MWAPNTYTVTVTIVDFYFWTGGRDIGRGPWDGRERAARPSPGDAGLAWRVAYVLQSTAAMSLLEGSDLADRHLRELSGGQRQRALVAQGLAQRADVLLLPGRVVAAGTPEAVITAEHHRLVYGSRHVDGDRGVHIDEHIHHARRSSGRA